MGQASSNSSGRNKNVRTASPALPSTDQLSSKLALGAGCYWGTEKYVRKDFQTIFPNSIKTARVGFMSPELTPKIKNPTYQQVCRGDSGHIEVLYIELNDPEKHFEELIRFFFQFHDPTTPNRQGNDRGIQYASWVFCGDEAQCEIATRVRNELQAVLDARGLTCFSNRQISTKIAPLSEFTVAQAAHQQYLLMNPNGYCNHRIRFKNWLQVMKEGEESASAEPLEDPAK